jgi:hypothetical protein
MHRNTVGVLAAAFWAAGGLWPAAAKSLLPGLLYEIDPALPASTAPLGSAPGIQIDAKNAIVGMKLAGSGELLGHGVGQSTLVRNGLDRQPIISNPAGADPGGWESLTFDPAAADPIAARPGQPFTVEMVARRKAATSCDFMKLHAKTGTHLIFASMPDGAILIGQNNGRGTATETTAAPLNVWDIYYYIYDGQRSWLLRNGERTLLTPTYESGGFGQDGSQVFQVLNGCAADVAWFAIAAQAPSIDQLNAESARLRAAFPSIQPQKTIDQGNSRATNMPLFVAAHDVNFLTTPNHPLVESLPVVEGATPGDGLVMNGGARNAFSLVMGSAQKGANMTTSESIRQRFFMNYMEGDLNQAIGSPVDTGQANNNTFAAVARHFRAGDPNDLHVMAPDGMHLQPWPCLGRNGAAPVRMASRHDDEGALPQPQG